MSNFWNHDMYESIGRLDSGRPRPPLTGAFIPQP